MRDGRIETETALPEGADVVVLTVDPTDTFEASASEEAVLVGRLKEADAGDLEPAASVLARLRAR